MTRKQRPQDTELSYLASQKREHYLLEVLGPSSEGEAPAESIVDADPTSTVPKKWKFASAALASIPGFSHGVLGSVMLYQAIQFARSVAGQAVSLEIPLGYFYVSLGLSAVVAYSRSAMDYDNNMAIARECNEAAYLSDYFRDIKTSLLNHPWVCFTTLVGAAFKSVIIFNSYNDLSGVFSSSSLAHKAVNGVGLASILFITLQYILAEGRHLIHNTDKSLVYKNYTHKMRRTGMSGLRAYCQVFFYSALPIFIGLTASGSLAFSEVHEAATSWFSLYKNAAKYGVGFGLVAGFIAASNYFYLNGERLKGFLTQPYRGMKENDVAATPYKLPSWPILRDHRELQMKLLLGSLSAVISGAITFSATINSINIFRHTEPSLCPIWLATMAGIFGFWNAFSTLITEVRYSDWRLRSKDGAGRFDGITDLTEDGREASEKSEQGYTSKHWAFDSIPIILAFISRVVIEVILLPNATFPREVLASYFLASMASIAGYLLAVVANARPFSEVGRVQLIEYKFARAAMLMFSQSLMFVAIGFGTEKLWSMYFQWKGAGPHEVNVGAHVIGTLAAVTSTFFVRLAMDYFFSAPWNDTEEDEEAEDIETEIPVTCTWASFFCGSKPPSDEERVYAANCDF